MLFLSLLYIFDKPVKYKDENGKIKDKKTALSSSVDKAEYQTDYQYVAKDNDIKTYFPKHLDGKKGVVTELGEHTLSMKPVVKANEKAPQPASIASQPAAQKKAVTGGQKEAVEYVRSGHRSAVYPHAGRRERGPDPHETSRAAYFQL